MIKYNRIRGGTNKVLRDVRPLKAPGVTDAMTLDWINLWRYMSKTIDRYSRRCAYSEVREGRPEKAPEGSVVMRLLFK